MAMKVLLGWELGAGQGHIQRLVALADRLEKQGCEPVFALKTYTLKGTDFPWQRVNAPRLPFSGRENSYTFADVLATFGFAQSDLLRQHLKNWQDILKTVNPDLVITDHAPGLVLAAQGLMPTVVTGSHFAVPPPVEIFPAFRSMAPPESKHQQEQVSETIRHVANLQTSVGQALNGDRSFIFSLPDLDFYRDWRQPSQNTKSQTAQSQTTQYVSAPIAPLPLNMRSPSNQPWTYLSKDYPAYQSVLNIFQTDSPFQPLQEALVDKSIAIHHGGLTTTIACLLAGIPQLILPRYIEQQLNGNALLRFNVAQVLINPTEENLLAAQAHVLSLAENAQYVAAQFSEWNQNFLDYVAESCLQLCV